MPFSERQLGRDGPKVAPLGFGLAALSIAYGPPPADEERFTILDRALELGATFWDSSDFYGDSEDLVGQWFKRTGKRNQIFLATKFGLSIGEDGMAIDSSGEACRRGIERSLERLGVGSVDLYYAHRLNPQTPVEETMRVMADLQKEGKIKHIGLSGVSANTLRRACKIAPVAAVQMEYSPFVLNIEKASNGLLATCRELGVSVVAYSPIGRGMLSDAFLSKSIEIGATDSRQRYPRFNDENFATNADAVARFKALAEKKNATPPQLALAWLLQQGNDIIPIPGTKRLKYLEDNWGAVDIPVTDEDEQEIRHFLENVKIDGSNIMGGAAETMAFTDTVEEGAAPSTT